MRLVSWNVNGLRAVLGKGFADLLRDHPADVWCLQETKAHPDQVDGAFLEEGGWHARWNSAEKKGYSGVAVFSKVPPLSVRHGFGIDEHDREGRVLTLEFDTFHLVNVYTPNAQDGLRRLPYRMVWDRVFLDHLKRIEDKGKPVVFGGDLNVAHQEIDLARPKENRMNPGFSDEERAGFGKILEAGFIDTFREFEAGPGHYSWWSFRGGARVRNVGWRIDYFGISKALRPRLQAAGILPDIHGSDHCPVWIDVV
ncbi:MAG: exodeoxyribonuclease III [Verrucomicrobiales bacterium]